MFLFSLTLIIIGIFKENGINYFGAFLYVFVLLIEFIFLIRDLIRYKKTGILKNEQTNNSLIEKIAYYSGGIIVILGLIFIFSDRKDINNVGLIIWCSTIIIYFFMGIAIRDIANIPIRHGYGGWQIYNKRRRK